MNMTLEALTIYINLPTTVDLCISHIVTSAQEYGTIYLHVYVRRAPSPNVFETLLNNLNLTIGFKCYCNFCT